MTYLSLHPHGLPPNAWGAGTLDTCIGIPSETHLQILSYTLKQAAAVMAENCLAVAVILAKVFSSSKARCRIKHLMSTHQQPTQVESKPDIHLSRWSGILNSL